MILLLEAINVIVRGSNKALINDLDDESQAAQVAKRTLVQTRKDLLGRGWGFNTRKISLPVNTDGKVPVGDYLSVVIPDSLLIPQFDVDGNGLFVWSNRTNVDTWHNATILDVFVVFDLPEDEQFRQIPKLCAEWIAHKASADFWTEAHDGNANQKLEAVAVRRQSRWTNTQGDLGDLRGVSGFSSFAGGRAAAFDPRTQSTT